MFWKYRMRKSTKNGDYQMITVICVGKLKEEYLIKMCNDYKKRINKYHKLEIIEVKDSNILEEENLIIKQIKKYNYKIALDIKGKEIDTIKFKEIIEKKFNDGKSSICLIIGGSDGISKKVKQEVDELLSFSKLTFPHGLFRAILLEQIYRAMKIINNETYHK